MRVAIASCGVEPGVDDPDQLLGRYPALTGWAGALLEAGAAEVTVIQQFHRDLELRRGRVDYRFVADPFGGAGPAWFAGARMTEVLGALAPEVAHVDGCVFPIFVRNLRAKLPRAVILVQDHGGLHDGSPGFRRVGWRLLHGFGLSAADGFLFTARELAAPWRRAGVIQEAKPVYEVPESSTDLGSSGAPPVGDRLPGTPALLWVGRLDANKDPLTILAGFERAAAALPGAALTMVFGDDRLLPAVRARIAASAALAPRVHLRGRLDREPLAALYASADLFVLGSHHEGSSFALIEALSFGVAPAVTDIPAFRALTGGGRAGALFPPGDVAALAHAIERLAAEDPASRRARVRAAFARDLSWSAVGAKALGVYREAVARRRVAPR